MRLIDANRLFDAMRRMKGQYIVGVGEVVNTIDVLEQIKEAPTIDAVPMIRCDECERQSYCHQTVGKTKRHDGFIEYWTEEIEWCSKGVRREDGES